MITPAGAAPFCTTRPSLRMLQATRGGAFSEYDYARDTAGAAYDKALEAAYNTWQVRGDLAAWTGPTCGVLRRVVKGQRERVLPRGAAH